MGRADEALPNVEARAERAEAGRAKTWPAGGAGHNRWGAPDKVGDVRAGRLRGGRTNERKIGRER